MHHAVRTFNAHAQEEIAKNLLAEALPVEEIAPAAHTLTDQQPQNHDVQIGGDFLLFDLREEKQSQNPADHAPVDGQTAPPDVEDGGEVAPIAVPAEDHIVDSGADNGCGHGEEDCVRHPVKVGAELGDSGTHVENGQQEAQGDHQAVEVDIQSEGGKGKGAGGIDSLDSQPGEGNGTGVK